MKSVQLKITTLFSALILGVLLAVGITVYLFMKQVQTTDFEENSKNTVEMTNVLVNNYFENTENILNTISNEGAFNNNYIQETVEYSLSKYQKNNSSFSLVYFGTEKGEMFLSSETKLPDDYDPRSRDWYTMAMESDSVIWTPAYADASTGNITITAAKAISINNKPIGVIAIDISLSDLSDTIASISLGKNGYMAITDSLGVILIHPDKKSIGKNIANLDFMKTVLSDKNGFMEYTYQGVDKTASYRQIDKTGWEIIGTIPASELNSKLMQVLLIVIICTVAGLVLVGIVGFLIARSISVPLKKVSKSMELASQGDLSFDMIQLKGKDEISQLNQSFHTMILGLRDIIGTVVHNSDRITSDSSILNMNAAQAASATSEVAKTINEIADGANEQAENTQHASDNISEIGELLMESHALVNEVRTLSAEIDKRKAEGFQILNSLVEKTEQNQSVSDDVFHLTSENEKNVENIEKASSMIESIADQINLLALNANIEAARAGEAGRGFAVIADETRMLAIQSSNFATEIRSIIEDLKDKSSKTVQTVTISKEISGEQFERVGATKSQFDAIADAITATHNAVDQLLQTTISLEERRESIVGLMQNLSAIAQENAAGTEESSASIEEQASTIDEIAESSNRLAEIAQELRTSVSNFKL